MVPLRVFEMSLRFFTVGLAVGKRFSLGGKMEEKKLNKEDCLLLLQQKYRQLQEQGEARYPKRADFSGREVVAIKAFLGPWPRALEMAGMKPPRDDDRKQKNIEKRIRAKRKRTEIKKEERDYK